VTLGKISSPVYIRLKKDPILKDEVVKTVEFKEGINFDLNAEGVILGFEFLDCTGIKIDGREVK